MQRIVLLGAGRSSTMLIRYLLRQCENNPWELVVVDQDVRLAADKINKHPKGIVQQVQADYAIIATADLVISMLPPHLHIEVAQKCIAYKKSMITASYASEAIRKLHEQAAENNVLIMMECGLDPGIDHMSAMKIIHEIQHEGGLITSFKSFCGGLVAPESDTNPWHYKISWNPRNVVLAGQGGDIVYLSNGSITSVTYEKLFQTIDKVEVDGIGFYDGYPNRDSLSYQSVYGLDTCKTLLRGTLRIPGFCQAWNELVNAGCTNDTQVYDQLTTISFKDFFEKLLPIAKITDPAVLIAIQWLGIWDANLIPFPKATSAQLLQYLMEQRMRLLDTDKDMVVMKHEFVYQASGKENYRSSSLVVKGDNIHSTAMAKTVGFPLGIVAKLILNNEFNKKGVHLPIYPEIYTKVLDELTSYGITFIES